MECTGETPTSALVDRFRGGYHGLPKSHGSMSLDDVGMCFTKKTWVFIEPLLVGGFKHDFYFP